MTQTEFRTPDSAEQADCACASPCSTSSLNVNRRTAIGAGVVAGAALVTGCSSGTTATTGTTSAATKTSAAAPAGTAASTSAAAPTSAGGGELAKSADVPAGGSLIVTVNKAPYALAKKADGTIVVHTAVCTHQKCAVAAAGAELTCPCHGSKFDAMTGAVLNGPAASPLAEVKVTESNGSIMLA